MDQVGHTVRHVDKLSMVTDSSDLAIGMFVSCQVSSGKLVKITMPACPIVYA